MPVAIASVMSFLGGILGSAAEGVAAVVGVLAIAKAILVGLTSLLATGVDSVLSIPIANNPVVTESWGIVRGFANMFFIIALIIMAFGTIFSIQKYHYQSLIVRFLIAALLVNLSLVIGEVIIDWTQSLSNVFLTASGSIGSRIAQGIDLANNVAGGYESSKNIVGTSVDLTVWQKTISWVANIGLLAIVTFSMAVFFLTLAARVFALWALLIFSPIAWLAYILPQTNNISRWWWKQFIGWNVFLPIYLFFIYFGLLFLQRKNDVLGAIATNTDSGLGITFQSLFFFLLVAVFFIGGAKVAMRSSIAAGAGGVAAGIWGKGVVMRRAAWRATGVPGVYKEAKERFQKEGFAGTRYEKIPIIGGFKGQRGLEDRQAKIAGALGVPGVRERQLERSVDAAKKTFQEKRTGEIELKGILADPSADKGKKIAAAQRLQEEFGTALTADQVLEMKSALGGTSTELAARTLRQVKWGEMSTEDLRRFTQRTIRDAAGNDIANPDFIDTDRNVESTVLNALIDRNKATKEEIAKAIELSRGTAQKTSLIRKSKEYLTDYASADDRKWLLNELAINTTLGATGEQGNESRVELLKIMAKKEDKFFHDNVGDPVQSELSNYANMFENPTELKGFLEDVSKKHADNVATELMNRRLLKDDAGNPILDTQEALKKVFSKLSVENKLTQNKSQYLRPHFQQAIAADMSRNNNTLQSYLSSDKYPSASGNIRDAQKIAREAIFIKQYYEPFVELAVKAHKLLRQFRSKTYSTLQALNQDLMQAREDIGDLKKIRSNYENLCRNNNILDASAKAQLDNFDRSIQMINQQMTNIANSKRP